jgi:hypothetical protein
VKVANVFLANLDEITEIACTGLESGSISLNIQGGIAPYEFKWQHDATLNSPTASNLPAGTYSVTVTDQLGCERRIENIEMAEPAPLAIASLTPVGVTCFGKPDGQLTLNVTGGVAPYTFEYDGLQTFSGSISLTEIPQGNFNWELKDANGCAIPVTFEITSPAALEVEVRLEKAACPGGFNGELVAIPRGGTGPFVFLWEDVQQGGSGNLLTGLSAGTYNLQVRDASGCVSFGRGKVSEKVPQVRMPTGFDPKQDGGLYQGVSNCDVDFELFVYNRWGQLIYSGVTGWDGTINGEEASTGTYTFFARYSFVLDGRQEFDEKRGSFLLIR